MKGSEFKFSAVDRAFRKKVQFFERGHDPTYFSSNADLATGLCKVHHNKLQAAAGHSQKPMPVEFMSPRVSGSRCHSPSHAHALEACFSTLVHFGLK